MWGTLLCMEFMSARALMMTSAQVFVEALSNVTTNKQPFSGLHSPGRSYFTELWYDPWVQTIYSMQNATEKKGWYVWRNVAHAWQEIMGRFCAEVTNLPTGTQGNQETLLAGYVSIPAKKEKNVWSQVRPVSTRDTPYPQQRACAHLLHCPHEGIVVAIWNMSQRPSRLRRLVAGAVWFPWSCLIYFTLFLFGCRSFVAPWILAT